MMNKRTNKLMNERTNEQMSLFRTGLREHESYHVVLPALKVLLELNCTKRYFKKNDLN